MPRATAAVGLILAAMNLETTSPQANSRRRAGRISTLGLLSAVLCACNVSSGLLKPSGGAGDPVTSGLRTKITTIVVIYAENRAFDNLYGNFPGAVGLSDVVDAAGHPLPGFVPQVDRNGSVLPSLPPAWGGVTASGYTPAQRAVRDRASVHRAIGRYPDLVGCHAGSVSPFLRASNANR